MSTMVIMVLDDVDKLEDVLIAWRAAGSGGVTILDSNGAARLLAQVGARDDLPMFPGLRNLLTRQEVHNRTLFTILSDGVDLEAFFDATEKIVGPFDCPNTGIIFAVPVVAARGLSKVLQTAK